MREYTYKDPEIELIHHLWNNTPKKIWYNFVFYVFDYGNYHLILECESKEAKSQNKYDEALIAELTRKNEKYVPDKHSKLVCENKPIDSLYIVRTFLHFSDFRNFTKPEKIANRIGQKIKTILKGKSNPLDEIISKTTGVGAQYICHPKSKEAKNVDLNFENLLDVGLLIEIENEYLRAYLQSNGFGFQIWKDKYFYKTEDLKEDTELYEFIKIEK